MRAEYCSPAGRSLIFLNYLRSVKILSAEESDGEPLNGLLTRYSTDLIIPQTWRHPLETRADSMTMAITTQPMEIAIVMAKTLIHMADLSV